MENLLDVRRKNHGTLVHSTIHYINVSEYNHVLPVQQPEQNRDSATKSYLQHKNNNKSNTKLKTSSNNPVVPLPNLSSNREEPTVKYQIYSFSLFSLVCFFLPSCLLFHKNKVKRLI